MAGMCDMDVVDNYLVTCGLTQQWVDKMYMCSLTLMLCIVSFYNEEFSLSDVPLYVYSVHVYMKIQKVYLHNHSQT